MNRLNLLLLIIVILLAVFMLLALFNNVHAGEIHGDFLFGYITETTRSYQVELGLEYDFELLSFPVSVGGSYLTQMEFAGDHNIRFAPYNEQYRFFTEINPFKILVLRYQHLCSHLIDSDREDFNHFELRGDKTVISIGVRW